MVCWNIFLYKKDQDWFGNLNLEADYLKGEDDNPEFKHELFEMTRDMMEKFTLERRLFAVILIIGFHRFNFYVTTAHPIFQKIFKLNIMSSIIMRRVLIMFFVMIVYAVFQATLVHLNLGSQDKQLSNYLTVLYMSISTLIGGGILYIKVAEYNVMLAICQGVFNWFFNILIITNVLRTTVSDYFMAERERKLKFPKKVDPYAFRSLGRSCQAIGQGFMNSISWQCNRDKYRQRIASQQLGQIFDDDNKLLKGNRRFDISITHSCYIKYSDFFQGNVSLYTSKAFVSQKRTTLKLLNILCMTFLIFTFMSVQTLFKQTVEAGDIVGVTEKWLRILTTTEANPQSEFELRRIFVDSQPLLLSRGIVETKQPMKGWPNTQYINTEVLNTVTDFVIKTTYKEIQPNKDSQFAVYAKKVFTDKTKTTGQPIKDDTYKINYYETYPVEGKAAPPQIGTYTIDSRNVTYTWKNDDYYAGISYEKNKTADYIYTFEKLVLDEYINKYTNDISLTFLINSAQDHQNYGLFRFKWARASGCDAFYFSMEHVYCTWIDHSTFFQVVIAVFLNMTYSVLILALQIKDFSSSNQIYNLWHKIEILKKFNTFMLKMRTRKKSEFARKFAVIPLAPAVITIVMTIINIYILVSIQRLYMQSQKHKETLEVESMNLEQQIKAIEYAEDLRTWMMSTLSGIVIQILIYMLKIFQSMVVVPSLVPLRAAILYAFNYITKTQILPVMGMVVIIHLAAHSLLGAYVPEFSNPLNIRASFKQLTRIWDPYPHSGYKGTDGIVILWNIQLSTAMLIPIRHIVFGIAQNLVEIRWNAIAQKYDSYGEEDPFKFRQSIIQLFPNLKEIWYNYWSETSVMLLYKYNCKLAEFCRIVPKPKFFSEFTDYTIAQKLKPHTRLHSADAEQIEENVDNQCFNLCEYSETSSDIFFRLILYQKQLLSKYQGNPQLAKEWARLDKSLAKLYYKMLNVVIDNGEKLNEYLAFERVIPQTMQLRNKKIERRRGRHVREFGVGKYLGEIQQLEKMTHLLQFVDHSDFRGELQGALEEAAQLRAQEILNRSSLKSSRVHTPKREGPENHQIVLDAMQGSEKSRNSWLEPQPADIRRWSHTGSADLPPQVPGINIKLRSEGNIDVVSERLDQQQKTAEKSPVFHSLLSGLKVSGKKEGGPEKETPKKTKFVKKNQEKK